MDSRGDAPLLKGDPGSASPDSKLPVVVIGAGVAGLYAAHLLQTVHNIKVVVVEASKVVGGRVRQVGCTLLVC